MKKIKWKPLLVNLAVSLGVCGLSAFLTRKGTAAFKLVKKPPFTPPDIVFPIVWTILFTLMGISAYIVYIKPAAKTLKSSALTVYAIQLAVNFFWSIIFFNLSAYLFAFVWIILLLVWIICMIYAFRKVSKAAAFLQIPYMLWVILAAYLNMGVYILNK